mmetsp:Transcript_25077/g.45311  ORF Transcript_25077/g.45311 Transcript_25077/m.45311 type:complete len:144 (-) Transcript_25077:233-664(-)
MKRRLAELSFDGEMLVEMNENQQDSEDEAVRLFHVVVHRFCHAFCQHHNDDDEEFGETKRVEINQIRKEIVMRAVYRAMDKLRRDRIEEVLNPGPYTMMRIMMKMNSMIQQHTLILKTRVNGLGQNLPMEKTHGCSRHVNNEK